MIPAVARKSAQNEKRLIGCKRYSGGRAERTRSRLARPPAHSPTDHWWTITEAIAASRQESRAEA